MNPDSSSRAAYSIGQTLSFNQQVLKVESFLAQGGFAQVFGVALLPTMEKRVLKRVLATDSFTLESCRNEIQFMQLLSNQKNIVRCEGYVMNSSDNGCEVLILMEYCAGGHLVDFLNTRLQNRLAEYEVLHIFSQICEAVDYLHAQHPPILHRDIKVENVLIATDGSFKLCDFGSATTKTILPGALSTVKDIHQMQDEINKVTTLQYRAPELCDLYQKMGISVKALGVVLYKLCYFTTPFEDSGQLAIVNARFDFPSHPSYSSKLKKLISIIFNTKPELRPTAAQLVEVTNRLKSRNYQGDPFDIINTTFSTSVNLPSSLTNTNLVSATSMTSSPTLNTLINPSDVTPMRRGRPTPKTGHQPISATAVQAIAQQSQGALFSDLICIDPRNQANHVSAANLTMATSLDPAAIHHKRERSDPSHFYHVRNSSAGSVASKPTSRTSLYDDVRTTHSSPFMNPHRHAREASGSEGGHSSHVRSLSNMGDWMAFDSFLGVETKQKQSHVQSSAESFAWSSGSTLQTHPSLISTSPHLSPSFVSTNQQHFGIAKQIPPLDLNLCITPPPKPPRGNGLVDSSCMPSPVESRPHSNYSVSPSGSPVRSAPLPSWQPLISLPQTSTSRPTNSTDPYLSATNDKI